MDERERLLGILEELTDKQLKVFAFLLPDAIPRGKRDTDSRVDLARVILQYYSENALDVVIEVLNKIPRKDLVLQLQMKPRRGGPRYDRTEEEREVGDLVPQLPMKPRRGGPRYDRTEEEREVAAAGKHKAPSKLVSQEQLMKLAKKMGKNWKEIGILFLGMEMSRLEQFEEEHSKNMVMQIFSMLLDWRNREKNEATARHLYDILNQEGVELDISAYAFLLE